MQADNLLYNQNWNISSSIEINTAPLGSGIILSLAQDTNTEHDMATRYIYIFFYLD